MKYLDDAFSDTLDATMLYNMVVDWKCDYCILGLLCFIKSWQSFSDRVTYQKQPSIALSMHITI